MGFAFNGEGGRRLGRASCLAGLVLLAAPTARAADGGSEDELLQSLEAIGQLTMEEVLNTETHVAGTTTQTVREAPGIVSVVTRDEMVASGARDLIDVLHLVPGLSFGQDVDGMVGIAVRGNWGFEGKVLVLIDGHELNELMYLTVPFGMDFPVELLDRVEVVRGPGSAVHGGYAELAVINVITRKARELHGVSFAARTSHLPDSASAGRRSVAVAWGQEFPELGGLAVSVLASMGEGVRSGQLQEGQAGDTFSMATSSTLRPTVASLDVAWKGALLRVLYDDWQILDRTNYGTTLPRAVWGRSQGLYLLAEYAWAPLPTLTITPRFRLKRQLPWHVVDDAEDVRATVYYDRTAQRWDGGLTVAWAPVTAFSLVGGAVLTWDHAWINRDFPDGFASSYGPTGSLSFQNVAGFAEAVYRGPVDLTAGARLEQHSLYGTSFVPRFALTRRFGDLHVKALFAQAFKAPGVENISSNPQIVPEHTTALEVEVGSLLTRRLYAGLNVFALLIERPIIYAYDSAANLDMYLNGVSGGTCGLEAELRYQGDRVRGALRYAFQTAACRTQPEPFRVAGDPGAVLGLANHQATLSGAWEVAPALTLAPTLLFVGGRAFVQNDPDGVPHLLAAQPALLADLFVTYRGAALRGAYVSLGGHNLFNQRLDFLQPYAGGKPPLRGFDRELTLRLGYDTP